MNEFVSVSALLLTPMVIVLTLLSLVFVVIYFFDLTIKRLKDKWLSLRIVKSYESFVDNKRSGVDRRQFTDRREYQQDRRQMAFA